MRSWRTGALPRHGSNRGRGCLFAVILIVIAARPASAQILTKTTIRPSESWSPLLPLNIGGGLEFQSDRQQTEYNYPLLVEYNFSEYFKLSIQPNITYLDTKGQNANTIAGIGDTEVAAEWEFLRERRYRPALTASGVLRVPTATHRDLGSPGWDYGLGLVASKDFVYVDMDLGLLYTFSGDPGQKDTLEISLAGEIPLNHKLALEFEGVTSLGSDTLFNQKTKAGVSGGKNFEGTVGLGWRTTKYLKLEGGYTLRTDGTWQVTFGWTYSFAGED